MEFDWDSPKATANARKHGVAFDEAATVFWMNLRCPVRIQTIPGEARYITFSASRLGKLLAVPHTHRAGAIRIISARRVTRTKRKIDEEG
jgi:uncharacterized DUF497 family protein